MPSELDAADFNQLAAVYELLSRLWLEEVDLDLLLALSEAEMKAAFENLGGVLPETVCQATVDELAVDYCQILIGPQGQVSPVQSVWERQTLQSETASSSKKFFDFLPNFKPFCNISDHIGVQLQFMAELFQRAADEDNGELVNQIAVDFFQKHLTWAGPFFGRRCQKSEYGFLCRVGQADVQFLKPGTNRLLIMYFAQILILTLLILPSPFQQSANQQSTKSNVNANDRDGQQRRRFQISYGASVVGLPENSIVKVWFPVPNSNDVQNVEPAKSDFPAKVQHHKDKRFGNVIGYFETRPTNANRVQFSANYNVTRLEAKASPLSRDLTDKQKQKFLSENKLVPIQGAPAKLLEGKSLPDDTFEIGRELYEIVDAYMKYDKSKPGYGNGDVLWACNSNAGNCTDFHSLFISLARNRNIPARFEIGFPIPTDKKSGPIGGYHCWAWFYTEAQGWVPVDISEADKNPKMKEYYFGHLTPDRVAFSTGRDIQLVPAANSEPLNYFVYPHVEVDGKSWPQEKIKMDFSFTDLPSAD